MLMYHETGFLFFKVLSFCLLTVLLAIIIYLSFRTTRAITKKEICVEEDE
jgi:tellurite resistance protein TehA-like permease